MLVAGINRVALRIKIPNKSLYTMNPKFLLRCAAILCAAFILTTASSFATPNPEKDVFFGETHVHTSWSFDAYTFGNTLTGPEDQRTSMRSANQSSIRPVMRSKSPSRWISWV